MRVLVPTGNQVGLPKSVPIDGPPEAALRIAVDRFADAAGPDINKLFREAERILIIYALNRERGVKLRAAKALGINRVTLDRKLIEHGLHVRRGRGVVDGPAAADSGGGGDADADEEENPARLHAV